MEKYENMVDWNRRNSQAKVEKAIAAMNQMFRDDEQVVVCRLEKKTGLSRAFFYNNKTVHNELIRLQELQEGKSFVAPQKVVLNKAMEKELELLRKKLTEKDAIIARQKAEIEKLKKAADANLAAMIKEL